MEQALEAGIPQMEVNGSGAGVGADEAEGRTFGLGGIANARREALILINPVKLNRHWPLAVGDREFADQQAQVWDKRSGAFS
jgi:hypothetical protein